MFNSIKINPKDNSVTTLTEINAGEAVIFDESPAQKLTAAEKIPFGHKLAIQDIKMNEPVIKYGQVIGYASADIKAGDWIHTHNLESFRGRGDVAGDLPGKEINTQQVQSEENHYCKAVELDVPAVFKGYSRADGSVGTRNYVALVSCVVCANDVVLKLSEEADVAGFIHQQGCSQTKIDIDQVKKVLINIASNPNVGAVIYVSLGCESVPSKEVLEKAKATGKPVSLVVIQEEGGAKQTEEKCRSLLAEDREKIKAEREVFPVSKLRIGLKCGSSDTTQGISANVVVGQLTDFFTQHQSTVIIGETTEFMGAEHIAAARCITEFVGKEIIARVNKMEERAKAVGVDMRGGQPTRGNIAGGLTTIEEKSLGALAKAGSSEFQEVIDYGSKPQKSGLIMMDSPGREPEMLTGLASAGCNLILFTTGRGAPQGFPFVPVVKITGNEKTWNHMSEHMDLCVAEVMEGQSSITEATREALKKILSIASGEPSAAEKNFYSKSMNIYVTGPVI